MVDFDERERRIENPMEDMLRQVIPIANQFFNMPKKAKVTLELNPSQLADLAELGRKWEKEYDNKMKQELRDLGL